MKRLRVDLGKNSYNIFIENGLKSKIGELIKSVYSGTKIAVITDNNLNRIYGELLVKNLENTGFDVELISIPAGEKSKSFDILPTIYDSLLDFELTRSDMIVAFGGGVVGDLAGFAASTFLRGVNFVQIPTSLLAQVDSSVGGKVAVDLKRGKNLIGSFYHPKIVIIDPDFLDTLSEEFFDDGLGEVIKYGCIKSKTLFEKLENYRDKEELKENICEIIYECCNIKREVVENDEKDLGERMILNFGHTLGHAIEKKYGFKEFTHGEAVGIGMYLITKLSEKKGLVLNNYSENVKEILVRHGLPFNIDLGDKDEIIETISLDKKNMGSVLKVVIMKEIGNAEVYNTTIDFFK